MKRSKATAVFIAGLILLTASTGCRHCRLSEGRLPTSRLGGLNLGMPKEDALKLLGQPETAATRLIMYKNDWKVHEFWGYRVDASDARFVVIFRDAKVVEYGPVTGERALDLEGLFEARIESLESSDSGGPLDGPTGVPGN